MSKSIAVYHASVPSGKNLEKINVLKFFSDGAKLSQDTVIDVQERQFHTSDVAVIQGWVTNNASSRPHQELRNRVIRTQLKHRRHVVSIDSNLFLYATPGNPDHYLRYSFDSVFPDRGIYCDTLPDPARWKKISSKLNIALKDYHTHGNHILLLLQRNGGWSMGNFDVQDWCNQTIAQLRQHTDRPIVVRAHPGDKQALLYLNPATGQCKIPWSNSVRLSTNAALLDDLAGCWAAVNYNSSPVVAAAIEGYPIFVTDPVRSQCRDIANVDLAQIESPARPDRQAWVERIAMSHWNFNELQTGQAWAHMRQYI